MTRLVESLLSLSLRVPFSLLSVPAVKTYFPSSHRQYPSQAPQGKKGQKSLWGHTLGLEKLVNLGSGETGQHLLGQSVLQGVSCRQ